MKSGHLYNVVFSDDRSSRWKRHLLFWLAVFLYHVMRVGLMMPEVSSASALRALLNYSLTWGVLPNLFVSYLVAYYLVPKYFNRQRYIAFAFSILLLIVILVANVLFRNYLDLNPRVRSAIGLSGGFAFFYNFRPGIIRVFGNPPLICCLFLSIKILKNWHLGQVESETLAKENASAELQLLKAQIHPHFLFNTLNNIYSFSLNQSPQATTLVRKLSGMLGYMINECDEKLVSLEKELKLIQDYMGLEKVRYGKRLDMQVEVHGDFENKLIAPLLMIPFVENSFKHGTSQMLQHPWIKLEITTVNDQLFFRLSNSKPSLSHANKQNKGIGLTNVQKRLHLVYPGRHQLDISETEDMFTVNMQILLEENAFAETKTTKTDKALAYA
jgi:hypothetical protein